MPDAVKVLGDQCNGCESSPKFKRITNYDYFINSKSKLRIPSALREIWKSVTLMPPHAIAFAVGVPNVATFPFQEVSVSLKDGSSFKLEGKALEAALQYMPSSGYAPLIKQLQDLQDKTHGPQDWTNLQSLMVNCGSSEPLHNVFHMILEEEDPVIIPMPLYTGVTDLLRPLRPKYIALEQDGDGIQPQQLRQKLQEMVQQNKILPKLMYVNPTACNPTGRNLSVERKRELYCIACDYNILILEDDPYYSLQFTEENAPSLLSMDVEGRVIRLDSFSKILSPGLRLGYITGPKHLVRQVDLHVQVTTLHAPALSQVLVSKMLDHWGFEKYFQHIEQVKQFYQVRRDLMLAACDLHLKGLAEWDIPVGGMFLWVRVSILEDTWLLAVKHCLERYLLLVPGHNFTGVLTPKKYNYVRLAFSLATPAQMDEGVKLFAEIIREQAKFTKSSLQ